MTLVTQTETAARNPFVASEAASAAVGDRSEAEDVRTYVTFELDGLWLAVDVVHIREILDRQEVTPLPRAPADVEGVIDVRGTAVAVVDLSRKLGVAAAQETSSSRFLVVELVAAEGKRRVLAMQADKVLEVSQIPHSRIETPPAGAPEWSNDLVHGVTRTDDRLVMLIDFDALFASTAAAGGSIFDFD